MKNSEKEKVLKERNDKEKAFKKDKEKQKERDQTIMPVDELPLEDIKQEAEEERQKEKTKDRSSSDPNEQGR
ncbi:hypothetical protein M3212_00475 [Alkalihalobacillus oceani]|uniref:hypothetical protein n=1 Tax=Halalkalibacter oceani TaxID=1653776 RepID=UPI00203CCCED|nr:hypothetical protein [Halalkalibacter oceani]MCM3759251.1 hypothetical protein [Halalkalibacter oceani]